MTDVIIDCHRCAIRQIYYPNWQLVRIWVTPREMKTIHVDYLEEATAANKANNLEVYINRKKDAYRRADYV